MRLISIHSLARLVPGAARFENTISHFLHALRHRANFRAVAHVMAIRFVALAGNVFSGLLTAAFLGPAGRGEQAAMMLAPTILTPLCTLGLHASLIYNIRSDWKNGSHYFGTAMILTATVSLAAVGLGYILIPLWLGHYDIDTIIIARLLLFVVPIGAVAPLLMGVLEVNGHFGLANRSLYFSSLGTVAILGVLAALGWLTPVSAAVAYVIPAVAALGYLLVHARRVLRPLFNIAAPYPQRLLRYGLQFYGVDVLGMLSGYLDQTLIVLLLAPAAVGAYVVALSLSRVLNVAQGAVSTVLFPTVSAREATSVVQMVAQTTRVTIAVNVVGATGLGLVGPSLLLLLYGTRFSSAVAPFLVLLAEAVVTSAARTLGQAFSGTGRPSVVTAVEAAGVLASLTAMLVMVPAYGIVGAACATLLGGIVRLGCVVGSFRWVLGVALPHLVISRADVAWVKGS
jgi:O-antigen/teichoic acid export membrane protein